MKAGFGIIADDFTGATDVGSLVARNGARVLVHSGVPAQDSADEADVHVVALKCRTVPADEAREQAGRALHWLKRNGCTRFYWKYCSTFDSTPKGNIGPVAEALLEDLGLDTTVYCPAFPENERTIYKGHLFVGDEALDESPMKDHPLTPMQNSNLVRLLEPQVRGAVGLIPLQTLHSGAHSVALRRAELRTAGQNHVVLDAVTDTDLNRLAESFEDLVLTTGGSAFAAALHAANGKTADSGERAVVPQGPAVMLSGSCSQATQEQVADFIMRGGATLRISPRSLPSDQTASTDRWLKERLRTRAGLVYSTVDAEELARIQAQTGTEEAAAAIEAEMARLARAAYDAGARRFIIAGGETSGAVTQALDVHHLLIGGEIAPGVPWCIAETGRGPIALVLKSGNFGTADFFSRAMSVLEENA